MKVILLPFKPSLARDEDPNRVVAPCIADGLKTTEVSSITANAYNAANRMDITDEIAKSLKTSGFSVAQIKNRGDETTIKESAWIITGPRGINVAYTIAQYIPESVVHYDPSINDETIFIVLGINYDRALETRDIKGKNPKGKLAVTKGCMQINNHGK